MADGTSRADYAPVKPSAERKAPEQDAPARLPYLPYTTLGNHSPICGNM